MAEPNAQPAQVEVMPTFAQLEKDAISSHDSTVEEPNTEEAGTEKPITLSPSNREPVYPTGVKKMLILASLSLVIFLNGLDRTILGTAIPRITDDFNSIQDVGWYGSSYLLTSAAFMLFFGRIYSFFSTKTIYLSAISIFELGSVICGAAPNSTVFIIGRAIAGLGSAAIMSGAMLILFNTVPLHERPLVQGLIGGTMGIASVAAPLLGGALTQEVTWRWCFYINLPIGGVTIFLLAWLLDLPPPRETTLTTKERIAKLDLLGTACFLPAIISLVLALQWGGTTYAWSDGRIIGLLVVFAVFIITFVAIQLWKQENATVPPRILKQRSIAAGAISQLFLGSTMIMIVYFMPIWFQAVQGVDAVESGIRTLPMILALVLGSILGGILINRIGYYTPFMIGGTALMSIGTGLYTLFYPGVPEGQWIGFQIPLGFGLGMSMQQANLAAQTILSRKDQGTGASIMFFAQTLGGAVFVAAAENIFTNNLVRGLSDVAGLDPAVVIATGATKIRDLVPPQYLAQVLDVYNDAIRHVFYITIATACLATIASCFVEWKSVKKDKNAQVQAPGGSKV